MKSLWEAILNPSSPSYERLRRIFGSDHIPLLAPIAVRAKAPGKVGNFYQVDVAQLSPEQIDRIVADLSERFGYAAEVIREGLFGEHGLPIPEEDLIVAFSMRAFQ